MSETLSPSEIQSLFAGLNLGGGTTASRGRATSEPEQSWAADQFTLPMALGGAELAALQTWQAAFGKQWSSRWAEPLANRFALQDAALHTVRLRDFVARHTGWQAFQVSAGQSGFPVWIALDDTLIAAHLDYLLGGNQPDTAIPVSLLGPLERQLTGRLVNSLCETLFVSTAAGEWQIKAVDSIADWIAGVPVYLSCEIIQFEFAILCSGVRGQLSLGIPRGACDKLARFPPVSASGPAVATHSATVQLQATLPPISLSLAEFEELQVGDVLLTPHGDQALCLVAWDGQQRFTASIGAHQGHKAIRLIDAVQSESLTAQ